VDDEDDDRSARAPEPDDVIRICRALNDSQRHVVVRVADEVVVDLMGRACGLSYAEASSDAETLERDGVRIPVASPATLIRTKETPRPQDAIDRAFLEGVLRERAARRG